MDTKLEGTGKADTTTKICSPEKSLEKSIERLKCPEPYNNFKIFLRKSIVHPVKKRFLQKLC